MKFKLMKKLEERHSKLYGEYLTNVLDYMESSFSDVLAVA